MNISYIEYSIATKSIDVFFSGCNPPYCKGCCNPELIDFNNGEDWFTMFEKIETYVHKYGNLIDNIFLVGGSPTHQNKEEMIEFLETIFTICCKDIWLFAREDLKDIPKYFKDYCAFIKCGEYIPELATDNNIQYSLKLATSNQVIYKKSIDY